MPTPGTRRSIHLPGVSTRELMPSALASRRGPLQKAQIIRGDLKPLGINVE